MKFDPRVTSEFDPLSRTSVCLCKITQWSHFINENTKKNRQKAFPNEKFIHTSLRLCFCCKASDSQSDLKEFRVNFEAMLSARAEYEKSVN